MILSNEPGFYKEGEYGIRLENLVLVIKDSVRSTKDTPFSSFETLSLCPIDLRLVKKGLLTKEEIRWLNRYHRRVRRELTSLLNRAEAVWLKKATRPI
jgi:Xaa-Pro aminopeptidase